MERRPWTATEDSILQNLVALAPQNLLPWNDIADQLKTTTGIDRSGKQCRERWANQLRPELTTEKQWSQEEQDILFDMHLSLGNHWSQIAKRLKGRSDNSIKNFFHSALKKALKKVNHHIRNNPVDFKNTKPIKDDTLSKLLKACGPKHQDLVNLGVQELPTFAIDIKKRLVRIMNNDDEQQLKQLGKKLTEFNKLCRKSKSKKKQEHYYISEKNSYSSSNKSNRHSSLSAEEVQPQPTISYMNNDKNADASRGEQPEEYQAMLTEQLQMDDLINSGEGENNLFEYEEVCSLMEIKQQKFLMPMLQDEDEEELQMKICPPYG